MKALTIFGIVDNSVSEGGLTDSKFPFKIIWFDFLGQGNPNPNSVYARLVTILVFHWGGGSLSKGLSDLFTLS